MDPVGEEAWSEQLRRRNWMAIAFATLVMMVSYFAYAAGFAGTEDDPDAINPTAIGFGLALAPFVFVILALVSGNFGGTRRVIGAMGLLLVAGLAFGLLSPVLGAAVGFALGGAVTLKEPPVHRVLSWRLWSVALTLVYTFVLLVAVTPAGVFTGGVLPLVLVGFADEYAVWRSERDAAV
ncbi:MAG: hypothetical protein S0880_29105 [Actinomycetota bacterium]|nr:hypothetical protein [Actinomycetota bacterium]